MVKRDALFVVFGTIFLFSVISLFFQTGTAQNVITGFQTQQSTDSNVTIESFVAIQLSANLADGIEFGTVSPGVDNINASDNVNGVGGVSTMSVDVDADSNDNAKVCIKASGDLMTVDLDFIALGNETFLNNSVDDVGSAANSIPLTTGYVDASNSIAPDNSEFYRFWLDIPVGTDPGTYNNTIDFKVVVAGQSC